MKIEKRINELDSMIKANELMLSKLESQPTNYLRRLFGTFASLIITGSILFFIMVTIFNTNLLKTFLEITLISIPFSILFSNSEALFMFPFIKKSLGLDVYEKNMSDIRKIKNELIKDKNELKELKNLQ